MARTRKARSDRNHVIYCIMNTATNQHYIGVTVCAGGINRAVKVRFQKHVRRALTENRDWALCRSIREWGADAHLCLVLEKVRGKGQAHAREREITRETSPVLNSL
nr:hypothetical protein [Oxalobacteraceae bacterium]